MTAPGRRPYRREAEETRRDALIAAALDLVSEGGIEAATVREIAARAGVTPGLIRHYFQTKEDLLRAAYARIMGRLTVDAARVLDSTPPDPVARLRAFVAASVRHPVLDPVAVSVWASFLHLARRDDALRAAHEAGYLGYRDLLQSLIADLPRKSAPERLRTDAIACNALIDGLWIEGGLLPEGFFPGELERIGLTAIGAILGVDLAPINQKEMP